jgi:hypothetical protein
MNKTEQTVREQKFLKFHSGHFGEHVDNIKQIVVCTFDGEQLCEYVNDFANSQPLNLDAREKIAELEDKNETLDAAYRFLLFVEGTLKNQLQAVTKERDEKLLYYSSVEIPEKDRVIRDLKSKTKELVRKAYIDALKEKKHMDYDEPLTVGEHAEALIHADNYCNELLNKQ